MTYVNRIAVVTGGASGIGREVARALAARGAAVAVADINAEGAQSVAAALVQDGAKAEAIAVDVSRPEQADAMIARAIEVFGKGRYPGSQRGRRRGAQLPRHDAGGMAAHPRYRLSGTFFCGQAAARHMVERGYGRIVNLASTAGVRGGTGRAAYGTAKGGVIALTKVMAVELAPFGVTVNALAPGAIETELVAKMHSAETRTVYRAGIPLDRYGTPEETAAAALFLASEEARYVTGHVLAVDGGFLAAGVMHRR